MSAKECMILRYHDDISMEMPDSEVSTSHEYRRTNARGYTSFHKVRRKITTCDENDSSEAATASLSILSS